MVLEHSKFVALFVREDSAYKLRPKWECYDINRNSLTFNGNNPVVAHPPCRTWGVLSHMAFLAKEGEKELSLWAIDVIRKNGGILEHPSGSRLFKKYLPDIGSFQDEYGGFTILIDQFDFGHVAHKKTKLYICGLGKQGLPKLPNKRLDKAERSVCGNVKDTIRCTQYQREYTPNALIDFFEDILKKMQRTYEFRRS